MKLHATGRDLLIKESERLISGSIKIYECEFTFDESWDGYTVTAVFSTNGSRLINMAVVDGKCEIPSEVLRPNARIRIGVFGIDGDRRRPTTYSEWITVEQGVDLGGGSAQPPTPSVYEQWLRGLDEKQDEWNANEEARAEAEAARVEAENARVEAEEAREAQETGYVAQAESWAKEAEDQAKDAKAWADKAQEVVGGDYATKAQAQAMADAAEVDANAYTDEQIAAIPTPDVSGQIGKHNTDETAHADIRQAIGNTYTKAETLAQIEAADKVGDIKTTTRTDLGEKWLLCNGEPIEQMTYPELHNLYNFGIYSSFVKDESVEGKVLDIYINEDCVVVATRHEDASSSWLVVYMKSHEDDNWVSATVFTSTKTGNYGVERAKVSVINENVFVVFDDDVASTSTVSHLYEAHCDKNDFVWSTPFRLYTESYYRNDFTCVLFVNGHYMIAFPDKSSYPHLAYSTDFTTWDGINTTIKSENAGTMIGVYFNETYGYYNIYSVNGTLRRTVPTKLGASGSLYAISDAVESNYAGICDDGEYIYFALDYAYTSNYKDRHALDIARCPINEPGNSTKVEVIKHIPTIVGANVLDMKFYDGCVYIMTSDCIYKYNLESGELEQRELAFVPTVGTISTMVDKMAVGVSSMYQETKPCVPKISLADTYAYIKAKE